MNAILHNIHNSVLNTYITSFYEFNTQNKLSSKLLFHSVIYISKSNRFVAENFPPWTNDKWYAMDDEKRERKFMEKGKWVRRIAS